MNLITLPKFEKNVNYRELTPLEGRNTYRYITIKPISITFEHPLISKGRVLKFYDTKGEIWAMIKYNKFIIFDRYAWDGCTPKKWWGIWWGSPDFKDTALASLIHDAMLQFSGTDHFPFNRLEIDNYFKYILEHYEFMFSSIYYAGVRIGSILPKTNYNTYSKLTSIQID